MNEFANVMNEAKVEMQCSIEAFANKLHVPPLDLLSWLRGDTVPDNPYVYMLAVVALKLRFKAETDPDLRKILGFPVQTEQLKELIGEKKKVKKKRYIIFPPQD